MIRLSRNELHDIYLIFFSSLEADARIVVGCEILLGLQI